MTTTVGSGIGSSLGVASEATWGTFATPTRWTEFDSESLEWKPKRQQGKGLANGQLVQRKSQRVTTTATVEGDIKTPLYYKGMGLYLGGFMGSLTAGAPVQQGGTAAWLQTHALAKNYGQGLSFQVGRPDLTGLITPYSYMGAKIIQAVLECGVDEYLMGTFSVDAKDQDLTKSYGAPTYLTPNPIFAFHQAQLRMGAFGSEVIVEGIRKFTLTAKRPMKVDDFYLDGTGRKTEQVMNDFMAIGLALDSDYVSDAAFVAQFVADAAQSIVIDFIGSVIAAGATKTITAGTGSSTGITFTSTAHGFTAGQVVTISGLVYTNTSSAVPLNGSFVITAATTNNFTIGVSGAGFTYTSGGSATQNYCNQFSITLPSLSWDGEPPKVGGPDIIQPKMKLTGLYDDTHTGLTLTYVSSDTTL